MNGRPGRPSGHYRRRQRTAGQTRVDTNSIYISSVLNELGIAVAYKAVVSDHRGELRRRSPTIQSPSVLILTGGLGPTDDDLTRDVVAAHFALPMHEDRPLLPRWRSALRPAAGECQK